MVGHYASVLVWDATQEHAELTATLRVDRVSERSSAALETDAVCPYDLLYEGQITVTSTDGRIDETLDVVAEGDRLGWASVNVDVAANDWNGSLELDPGDTVNLVISMIDGDLHGEIATHADGDLGRW